MQRLSLDRFPLHLGRGARAVPQPEFAGTEWFAAYVECSAGDYAINPRGVWHTADVAGHATALFITAGVGTEHRPR